MVRPLPAFPNHSSPTLMPPSLRASDIPSCHWITSSVVSSVPLPVCSLAVAIDAHPSHKPRQPPSIPSPPRSLNESMEARTCPPALAPCAVYVPPASGPSGCCPLPLRRQWNLTGVVFQQLRRTHYTQPPSLSREVIASAVLA